MRPFASRAQRRRSDRPAANVDVLPAGREERRRNASATHSVDVLIARLATRQGGVVTRAQLLGLGLTSATIGRWLASGRLLRLHRGVYAVGHGALTWRGTATAALLAVGDGAVLSHRSAAAAWRILPERRGPIEATVVGAGRRARPGIAVHRTARLDAVDIRTLDGVALTAPARTLVDLARAAEPDIDRALAEAQVLRLVGRRDLEAAIARAPGPRGLAALRAALDSSRGAPTRSEVERLLLRLVEEAGLPRPLVNTRVGRHEVDFLWPQERVVVETDGWAAHGHRRAFERDRARDAELQARGYVVVRFTWRQISEERVLVATRLAQVLAARARSAGEGPVVRGAEGVEHAGQHGLGIGPRFR